MIIIISMDEERFNTCTYPRVKKDLYSISNYGGIKRNDTGKIFYPKSVSSNKYIHTSLLTDNYKKYVDVNIHRLVAWEFVDGYNEETSFIQVNHRDSNRYNNYYENLEWCTVSHNLKHAFSHGGRKPVIVSNKGPRPKIAGSLNPNVKFSEDFIHRMCRLLSKGNSVADIMKLHDSTKKSNQQLYTLLMNIKHRKSWHNITSLYEYKE